MKKFSRSFSALHGVKLPWLLIALSFVFSAAMMNAELQAATLTAGIIDTSQNAIDAKLLTNFIVVTALAVSHLRILLPPPHGGDDQPACALQALE